MDKNNRQEIVQIPVQNYFTNAMGNSLQTIHENNKDYKENVDAFS